MCHLNRGADRRPAGAEENARPEKGHEPQKLDSFTDLTPGDLVVHEHHGIGRYVGMEQLKVGGVTKDYVKIAYQGTDCLYVPATQLDLVSKYIGAGEDTRRAPQQARRRPVAEDEGQAPRPRPRIWPRASSSSTLKESGCRASPSRRIRRGSRNLRRALNTPRPTISCAASTRSRRIWSRRRLWTGCSAATSASARRRSPCARP
ncbi:MAG: CarD family transcriptional regulator [Oscillospiraceae bacterium]